MNLILTDGCGNNYPVSPCPPPSTTVPPPNTASTGGDVAGPVLFGGTALILGVVLIGAARLRRKGSA